MAFVKVGELRSVLESFANALEANKADRAAVQGLRDLGAMFAGNESKAVPAFLKNAERVDLSTHAAKGPLLADVVPVLLSLRSLVNDMAKRDLNNSLDSLLDVIRAHADSPISVFTTKMVSAGAASSKPKGKGKKAASAMNDRLVEDYVKRLEAALGDETKFEPLLAELTADGRVGQAEAVAIASQFYGQTRKSTSRPKALQRVQERQSELMKFKRQPSTAGRPAA